jgi:hypothetical protein
VFMASSSWKLNFELSLYAFIRPRLRPSPNQV